MDISKGLVPMLYKISDKKPAAGNSFKKYYEK